MEALRYVPDNVAGSHRGQIYRSILKTRDKLASNDNKGTNIVVAYDLEQDYAPYRELKKYEGIDEYTATRNSLNSYTKTQIETHIGERLHVGISRFKYHVKGGELLSENTGEPVLNMFKRGREYRKRNGKPVDWQREDAEVAGFEQIQKLLANKNTQVGTMMLSVSPQGDVRNGSIYKQNFYDIFQKTEEGIVAYRFTSGLTPAESQERVKELDKRFDTAEVPKDYQFLSRPILLDNAKSPFKTPEQVHEYMHNKHSHMSKEEFDRTIEECAPLITSYINTLCENPYDLILLEKKYNAVLNYADIVAGKSEGEFKNVVSFERRKVPSGINWKEEDRYVRQWIPTMQQIEHLAEQAVRQVDTPCGPSGKASAQNSQSAYSVVEFSSVSIYGADKYGRRDYECPSCHSTNVREENVLDKTCPKCDSSEVAC